MNTKTTISLTEARKRIFEISDAVQNPDTYYTLTENGRPKAVLMSAEEFESWRETLEIIEDCPDFYNDMKDIESDLKTRKYTTYITLEEVLAQRGYIVAEKAKKQYGISRVLQTPNKKRVAKTH